MKRIAFLGCGYMGKVILKALLETKSATKSTFLATTATSTSTERLRKEFANYTDRVKFIHNGNVKAVEEADVIFLTFPPDQTSSILNETGMSTAVNKKLIISVIAGVSQEDLEGHFQDHTTHIVRIIPTIAAQVGESTTLMAIDKHSLPEEMKSITETFLTPLGSLIPIQAHIFNPVMAMMAATHSLMVVALDSIIDSSAAEGIPRLDTLRVVSQSFRGYATLLTNGYDPAELKNSMLIPNGYTVNAIVNLDRQGVRAGIGDTIAKTISKTKPR